MFKRLCRLVRALFFSTQEERDTYERSMRDAPEDEIRSRFVTEITARNNLLRMIADSERKLARLERQAVRAQRDGKVCAAEQFRREQRELSATLDETRRILLDAEESVRVVKEMYKAQDRERLEEFKRKMEEFRRQRDGYSRMPYGSPQPLPDWLSDPAAIMVGILIAVNLLLICVLILLFSR